MAVFDSILLGISVAAIPGPIFFEVIRRTLTNGLQSGSLFIIGEFIANITILMMVFFGMEQFLLYRFIRLSLFFIGGAILIWIGFLAISLKPENVEYSAKKRFLQKNSIYTGLAFSITSPLNVFLWISMGGAYLAQYSARMVALINIVLLDIGAVFFHIGLAVLSHSTCVLLLKCQFSTRYVLLISKIFGIILIWYGIYFWYLFIVFAKK